MISAVRSASTVRSARCTSRSLGTSSDDGRLVQDQHRGVGQEGARERDQLPLPGGQPAPALADVGVVAVRQRLDELVGADRPRAAASICALVASGRPKRDVVGDGAAEQEVLLRHHGDHAAELRLGQVAQRDAVDRDPPLQRVVEARQQPGDRGLARAGRAEQRDRLARRDASDRTRAARPARPGTRTGRRRTAPRRASRRPARGAGSGGIGTDGSSSSTPDELLQRRGGALERVVELADSAIGSKNRRR